MHRGVSRLIGFVGVLALTGACTPQERAAKPRHRIAKVNSFTEATPVYQVVSAPPYAFAATAAGLDQWDLRSGRRIRRDGQELFKARIADLAYDAKRSALWVVGSDGIARYDLGDDTITHIEPPPGMLGTTSLASAVLTAAPDGGIYLGVSSALFHADPAGAWREAELSAPIAAVHVEADTVYVGTAAGLFSMRGVELTPIDCDLAAVRLLLHAPGGGVLALGVADAGQQRVAIVTDGQCESFRPSPEIRWLDVTSDGDRAIILTRSRVYELTRDRAAPRVRRLSRDGMTLIPTTSPAARATATNPRPPMRLRALGASVPPGAQTVAVSSGELLVGTRSLGTARLAIEKRGDDGDSRWLRREELATRAALLSVHCEDESDCRLANGSGEVWRFDGERFARRDSRSPVLGLVDVAGSAVAVLARDDQSTVALVTAPATGELAEPVALASVRVPEGYQLRRLRAGRGRSVLLGWVRAGATADAPLALAHWVRLKAGETKASGETRAGSGRTIGVGGAAMLDVVACGGRVYAATAEGIHDVTGAEPSLVAKLEATRLGCDREQLVAATHNDILRRSSGEWSRVVALAKPVRDFAIAADGRVYLADALGLGLWDGNRVRRYDVRRGLLENDLQEIALDRFGRIWIRGASGVGLFRL